jgi:hypothetical protein
MSETLEYTFPNGEKIQFDNQARVFTRGWRKLGTAYPNENDPVLRQVEGEKSFRICRLQSGGEIHASLKQKWVWIEQMS